MDTQVIKYQQNKFAWPVYQSVSTVKLLVREYQSFVGLSVSPHFALVMLSMCSAPGITMSVFFKLCEDVRETGPVEWQGYRVRCVSVWPHRHVSRVYLQWKHEFLSPTLYTSMGMKHLSTWFQGTELMPWGVFWLVDHKSVDAVYQNIDSGVQMLRLLMF